MPTPKQKLAFDLISENLRNPKPDVTLGKTMLQAGYSPQVALKPKLVTESKGFRELMDAAGLDDASLTRKHKQLLESRELKQMMFDPQITDFEIEEIIVSAGCTLLKIALVEVEYTTKKGEVKTFEKKACFYSAPDALAQDRALDKAYKLKGSYAPEKKAVLHGHVDATNNPKVKQIVSNFEEELKKTLMQ